METSNAITLRLNKKLPSIRIPKKSDSLIKSRTKFGNSPSSTKNSVLESMLEGSPLSHYNTLVAYSRIPHKYDHFHEKTYIPGIRSQRFPRRLFSSELSRSLPRKPVYSRLMKKT